MTFSIEPMYQDFNVILIYVVVEVGVGLGHGGCGVRGKDGLGRC